MAFTSVATSLTHIISVTPYIADFVSAYNSIQDFISFPTSMSIFFPNTPISKGIVYLSFLAFLSPPLSFCFSWLLVSLASTSFCGLASTDFSSGLASFNRFLWLRFIRCTSKKLRFVLRKDLQRECQYWNYADAKCDSQYLSEQIFQKIEKTA